MKTPHVRFVILAAFSFGLLVILSITFLSSSNAQGQTVPAFGTIPPPVIYTWTTWGAQQYAVADAGDDFWIGASGGIVRWHKPSQSYQRYSGVDGPPHRHVYAVAVDGAGNRWFGGDGGLSLLDINEVWTHFTPANSGLQTTLIDGIALGADNTLWVSHGLPDGRVSRRNPDGSWTWFPSRAAAVTSDYARIVQTQNQNPLWAVAEGEVWVDFLVYDGTHWLDRKPGDVTEAPTKVMSAAGSVWALARAGLYDVNLYQWKSGTWSGVSTNPFYLSFNSYATSFAVAESGEVWFGYNYRAAPYTTNEAAIFKLGSAPSFFALGLPVPIRAMLIHDAGVWTVGPSWLRTPDGAIHLLTDTLVYPLISDVALDGDSTVWLNSYDAGLTYYSRGLLQNIKDFGTSSTQDDQWNQLYYNYDDVRSTWHVATAWERTPSGDLVSAWAEKWHLGWLNAGPLRWDRQGSNLKIPLPNSDGLSGSVINDIYARDDHHFFIVYNDDFTMLDLLSDHHHVLAFDDNSTPSDLTDDRWQTYSITSTGRGDVVAVDAGGRLWFGNSSNLYRWDNGGWQTFFAGEQRVCDLTADGIGNLYLLTSSTQQCDTPVLDVARITPDNKYTIYNIRSLVPKEYFTLRASPHRNKLWAVAADGAIWYIARYASSSPGNPYYYKLERYDGSTLTSSPLPFTPQAALQLEVDAYNNVWFVHDNQVWRMSQPPGFVLAAQPLNWQVEPGLLYSGQLSLISRDGYKGKTMLSVRAPSNEISITVAPNRIAIGESANFTLSVAAGSQQSSFAVKLLASNTVVTQTVILSVTLGKADPTRTPLPPTPTATNTSLPPTSTSTNTPLAPSHTPTNMPTLPTATLTVTSLPSTATSTNTPLAPTVTPTSTPFLPTVTAVHTPMPPTATSTNTPLVPTHTPMSTPAPPIATMTTTPVLLTSTSTTTPPSSNTPIKTPNLLTATATKVAILPTATLNNTPTVPANTPVNTPTPPTATATGTLMQSTYTPVPTAIDTSVPSTTTLTYYLPVMLR